MYQKARFFLAAALSPLPLLCLALAVPSVAQELPLAWDQVKYFRYNIELIKLDTPRVVTVVYSVTNPTAANAPYDLKSKTPGTPFLPPARLGIDIAWNTAQYTNTGSTPPLPLTGGGEDLLNISRTWMNRNPPEPGGIGAATANQVNALSAATPCLSSGPSPTLDSHCVGVANPTLRFWVTSTLPSYATGTGTVGLEGHPTVQIGVDPSGKPIMANVPATSAVKNFKITDSSVQDRPAVITITKCQGCHDGLSHDDHTIPRLSLHGANRNEEPRLCVVCHNANQTDIPYRSSGSEESIDFKRMVHGIHAGEFRDQPLIIIGFRGSIHDYSTVRFPKTLSNCTNCHLDAGGKGTFELGTFERPLRTGLLGSTINTGSLMTIPGFVDTDPANNLRISPIAATCSGCHGKAEVRTHMIRNGASFGATQEALAGKEQCVNCHGPGKSKDVRRVHEIGEHEYDDH